MSFYLEGCLIITPLSCAVEDEVFNAVRAICGEDVAWNLCYSDPEEIAELKQVISIILNGVSMSRGGTT